MRKNKSAVILRDLFEAFPPLDPASEFYGEDVNGGDVVDWLASHAATIRETVEKEC